MKADEEMIEDAKKVAHLFFGKVKKKLKTEGTDKGRMEKRIRFSVR